MWQSSMKVALATKSLAELTLACEFATAGRIVAGLSVALVGVAPTSGHSRGDSSKARASSSSDLEERTLRNGSRFADRAKGSPPAHAAMIVASAS